MHCPLNYEEIMRMPYPVFKDFVDLAIENKKQEVSKQKQMLRENNR